MATNKKLNSNEPDSKPDVTREQLDEQWTDLRRRIQESDSPIKVTGIIGNLGKKPKPVFSTEQKDIDTYYLKDLKCEVCGESLKLLNYDRFSDRKGQHFIVARMWCDDHKNIWVQPYKKERIYLDGPDAPTIKSLEDVHMALSSLASSMEGKEVPLSWQMSMDFWGFREDFSDAVKAKLQVLRDFEGIVESE